ncbi:hypothetical protein Bca4012_016950 [Brassica carinata]
MSGSIDLKRKRPMEEDYGKTPKRVTLKERLLQRTVRAILRLLGMSKPRRQKNSAKSNATLSPIRSLCSRRCSTRGRFDIRRRKPDSKPNSGSESLPDGSSLPEEKGTGVHTEMVVPCEKEKGTDVPLMLVPCRRRKGLLCLQLLVPCRRRKGLLCLQLLVPCPWSKGLVCLQMVVPWEEKGTDVHTDGSSLRRRKLDLKKTWTLL